MLDFYPGTYYSSSIVFKAQKKINFSTKEEKDNETSKKLSLFDGFDASFNRIYYNLS